MDKGLVPLSNSNNESWCQGLDGLAQRTAEYYKQVRRPALCVRKCPKSDVSANMVASMSLVMIGKIGLTQKLHCEME